MRANEPVPFGAAPHPAIKRALHLNAEAAALQLRSGTTSGAEGISLAIRADMVRESCRRALAEVVSDG